MVIQLTEIGVCTWILGGGNHPTTHLLAACLLVAGTLWLTARLIQSHIRNFPLPPGPKGLPLIGNVLHATDQKWLASPQRKDDYGDAPYLQCPINHAHASFRRNDVYKRVWERHDNHQQPTRRRRFA
jgi:hypothetical protein